MHGRRSLEPDLIPYEPKVNRLCREIRARSSEEMGSQHPAEGQMPAREEPPRLLREFFISNEHDRGVGGMKPQIGAAHYKIKASTLTYCLLFMVSRVRILINI
ncbi:unnamed protein product [Victoria cruziana]